MNTWQARKFHAAICKWEVVVDNGPNYCPQFVSKHLTKEKAESVAQKYNDAKNGKTYKVIPV